MRGDPNRHMTCHRFCAPGVQELSGKIVGLPCQIEACSDPGTGECLDQGWRDLAGAADAGDARRWNRNGSACACSPSPPGLDRGGRRLRLRLAERCPWAGHEDRGKLVMV